MRLLIGLATVFSLTLVSLAAPPAWACHCHKKGEACPAAAEHGKECKKHAECKKHHCKKKQCTGKHTAAEKDKTVEASPSSDKQ